MSKELKHFQKDFEQILTLITEAQNRVYSRINSELVLLYYNVGGVVSEKVILGNWGDDTVQQLSNFILSKIPNLSGFNSRGLYRMKQFYELYKTDSEVFQLWKETSGLKVSPSATQIENCV